MEKVLLLRPSRRSGRSNFAVARALFDSAWYRYANADVALSDTDAFEHFMSVGWAEGRKPHPLFDTEWYLRQNPDVEQSGANPLVHYANFGWKEGRNPNALFDVSWYLERNIDVRDADVDPLLHYISAGAEERREPNALFDPEWYEQNSEVACGFFKFGLAHYLTVGWQSGRAPNPFFNVIWYRAQSGIKGDEEPLSHFLRSGGATSPHPLFDSAWYREQNPDVAQSGLNPFTHYLMAGRHERRRPSSWFDPIWYLNTYPDVARSGVEPFEHFLQSGAVERRRPSSAFHTDWYAEQYPDATRSGMNLLEHYLTVGHALGYKPTSFEKVGGEHQVRESTSETRAKSRAKDAKSGKRPTVPTLPNSNSGQLVKPRVDDSGGLSFPAFQRGDGRRLASIRRDRQHCWYDGPVLDEYLDTLGANSPLSGVKRLLVIGHDFSLSTGVLRPLSHYLNALAHAGGIEITSLELVKGADALVAQNEVEVHDFVIINSLSLFFDNYSADKLLLGFAAGKCAVYLHETDYIFDKLQKARPEEYKAFCDLLPQLEVLTVSEAQEEVLRRRFNAHRLHLVSNTSPITHVREPRPRIKISETEPLTVVMAGTIQPRKGVNLFSEVADLAKRAGLPWNFKWAGGEVGMSSGLYRSENVEFVGNLNSAEMECFLQEADVFLLSSEDDPFPLACLEAMQKLKRVVAYHGTGTAGVIRGLSGCAVYEAHNSQAAFAAVSAAVSEPLQIDAMKKANERFSLTAFVNTMNETISKIRRPDPAAQLQVYKSSQRVAVILHLYYHDLWPEIAGYLENVRHISPDVYVTLTDDKSPEERSEMRAKILKRWPQAAVLDVPNSGMDIGPFVEVARRIQDSDQAYDLVLKVHSKKSLVASGEIHGREWRRSLLAGLCGSPTDVDRILTIFEEHPTIGMVGPRGMLIEKSSKDLAAGHVVNAENMNMLADRMGISDRRQSFFRGTMFWARTEDVLAPIQRAELSIADFEPGHQPDNSRAHAMERLFACMVRSRNHSLHVHDKELPKPVSLLKNRHQGEDIYIIAAGASAGFIDPAYFEGKTVIGVNRVFVRFPCKYVIFKEYANGEYERELLATAAIPVISKWDSGNLRQGKMRLNTRVCSGPRYYYYDHLENGREVIDMSVIDQDSDKLVVSYSTITTAMHLAAYMGAKNIILVGHDCGTLDGQSTFSGYYKDASVSAWANQSEYTAWLSKIESQTIAVRGTLETKFGIRIFSLNPFVNFGLEGHAYSRGS